MNLLREYIRRLLAEDAGSAIKVQNYGNGISAVLKLAGLGTQGYVTAHEVLQFEYCTKDVEKLQAQGHGTPGGNPDFPTLGSQLFAVTNSRVNAEFRGLGYGKELYKALIEEVGNQAGDPGAFVGADECAAGSTSKDAQRVWKSLARDYPSSGNVVYVGPK